MTDTITKSSLASWLSVAFISLLAWVYLQGQGAQAQVDRKQDEAIAAKSAEAGEAAIAIRREMELKTDAMKKDYNDTVAKIQDQQGRMSRNIAVLCAILAPGKCE